MEECTPLDLILWTLESWGFGVGSGLYSYHRLWHPPARQWLRTESELVSATPMPARPIAPSKVTLELE